MNFDISLSNQNGISEILLGLLSIYNVRAIFTSKKQPYYLANPRILILKKKNLNFKTETWSVEGEGQHKVR